MTVSGVSSEGLKTVVSPVASAETSVQANMKTEYLI